MKKMFILSFLLLLPAAPLVSANSENKAILAHLKPFIVGITAGPILYGLYSYAKKSLGTHKTITITCGLAAIGLAGISAMLSAYASEFRQYGEHDPVYPNKELLFPAIICGIGASAFADS